MSTDTALMLLVAALLLLLVLWPTGLLIGAGIFFGGAGILAIAVAAHDGRRMKP